MDTINQTDPGADASSTEPEHVPVAPMVSAVSESDSDISAQIPDTPAQPDKPPQPPSPAASTFFVGDVWTNGNSVFRVDEVTDVGGVNIRFREETEERFLFQTMSQIFQRKEAPPRGEWFFGSGKELEAFIQEGSYQFERHAIQDR